MSSKTQSEYETHIRGLLSEGELENASKLIYQWVKTGKLKQTTFMGLIKAFIKEGS